VTENSVHKAMVIGMKRYYLPVFLMGALAVLGGPAGAFSADDPCTSLSKSIAEVFIRHPEMKHHRFDERLIRPMFGRVFDLPEQADQLGGLGELGIVVHQTRTRIEGIHNPGPKLKHALRALGFSPGFFGTSVIDFRPKYNFVFAYEPQGNINCSSFATLRQNRDGSWKVMPPKSVDDFCALSSIYGLVIENKPYFAEVDITQPGYALIYRPRPAMDDQASYGYTVRLHPLGEGDGYKPQCTMGVWYRYDVFLDRWAQPPEADATLAEAVKQALAPYLTALGRRHLIAREREKSFDPGTILAPLRYQGKVPQAAQQVFDDLPNQVIHSHKQPDKPEGRLLFIPGWTEELGKTGHPYPALSDEDGPRIASYMLDIKGNLILLRIGRWSGNWHLQNEPALAIFVWRDGAFQPLLGGYYGYQGTFQSFEVSRPK